MTTQALMFAGTAHSQAWLRACLDDALIVLPADARQPDAVVAEVQATPDVSLVFVELDLADRAEHIALVEALVSAYPRLPVVVVSGHDSSDAVLSAMRAGAEDFLVVGRDDDRVADLIERVLARSRQTAIPAEPVRGHGRVVSVVSAANAAQLAFVAGHIAFVLQAERKPGQRVLLLDLSRPGGNAAILFDGGQNYTAIDILGDVERCDETLIESAFQKLDNGVYLLGLPEALADHQLAEGLGELDRLLEVLRGLFDYVVVDADRGLGVAPLATVIGRADHALLLSDQSVLASRQSKALLAQLHAESDVLDHLQLVINNYRSDIGMAPEQLAELLGLPLAATLAGRTTQRLKAMNSGESMFESAPNDAFSRGVQALTAALVGLAPPRSGHGFSLGGLFGRRRRG
ncbi:hypothetical protein [Salinisphaera sp. T31B1]|uniref:AAA family ATPase n=1 Tax=Salinisphaera sp. T31B1 TaxID=727963 RepID=UPI00333FDF44